MQAMILAAGFGTRLLPYTEKCPKPLFPLFNRSLLLVIIERLKKAGFLKIIINCHHLSSRIAELVKGVDGVIVIEEKRILGTGGGLRNALDYMDPEPLLVTNGDIFHDIDYRSFYDCHINDVTLCIHDYPRFNKILVDNDQVVSFSGSGQKGRLYAFTGLHVINPEVLRDAAKGEFSCIIDLYKRFLEKGGILGAHEVKDRFWTDMGTKKDYLRLHAELLNGVADVDCLDKKSVRPLCIGEHAIIPDDFIWRDWCVIGNGAKIGKNVRIERSVIWENSIVEDNVHICDDIIM